jgi:hypothetical protein
MAKDPIYYDLLETSTSPGCPVCKVVLNLLDRYLDSMFYESVNDVPNRELLRKSMGFCNQHAWRLHDGKAGNALGIAIIYHDIITNLLRRLPEVEAENGQKKVKSILNRFTKQSGDSSKTAVLDLSSKEDCPACKHSQHLSRLTTTILLIYLQDERLKPAFEASEGLCIPHLKQAIDQNTDETNLSILLTSSREKLAALNAELSEFIRKNDYRFRDEGFGSEGNSWRKALSALIGERNT